MLRRLWSPTWHFSDDTYAETAVAFDNPDFVDVVVHSYRHRYGYVPGDPMYADIEARLSAQPPITIPTLAMYGIDDGVSPLPPPDAQRTLFRGRYERRDVPGAGHNLPQEQPTLVTAAILDLLASGIS